ncbi:MAG TPA: HAD-IA family hydrolase [Candidatus Ozemobacteraceae bacterium]|nr:HAD-IA family hydrolase [Candidatus Ozemobacteraceae bacterium]
MTLKAVFFDVGGTLIFPNPERIGATFAQTGSALPTERWLEAVHRASASLDAQLEAGKRMGDDWWQVYFGLVVSHATGRPAHEWSGFKTFLKQLKDDHVAHNLWDSVAPGAPETVERLQMAGFSLGVISNSDGRVRYQLQQAKLAERFSFIIDSYEVGCDKPDAKIFHLGLKHAGLKPQQVLYVGDFVEIDHRGATGVGMEAVIIDPLRLRRHLDGVRFIDSISQLPSLLDL